jgi:hypothetical protein
MKKMVALLLAMAVSEAVAVSPAEISVEGRGLILVKGVLRSLNCGRFGARAFRRAGSTV